MSSFIQLPFLQALGYAIANSVWQVALLWLIVILANSIAKQSSHTKYITALCAQLAGFVWFTTTFQFYYHECRIASIEAQQLFSGQAGLYQQSPLMAHADMLFYIAKTEELLPYLSIAYIVLLLLLAIKWITNYQRTRVLTVTGLQPAEAHWQAFVNDMADRLGILQYVKIHVSSVAKSPLTIGYVKPVILLPLASINHLTTEQLEAVLLHELAHIKRADYIINLLVSIVETILFFNPFTRLLSHLIQKERENCCDDWVLQFQYNAAMYAEALLRIAYIQKTAGFQMNAAVQKKGELLQRVKRIVQPAEKPFSYKHQVAALLLLTGILCSLAWLQPQKNSYKPIHAGNIKTAGNIVITPLTAQVENPFFNPAFLLSKSLQEEVKQSLAQTEQQAIDSTITISLQQARKALQKAAPVVNNTVSPDNWQNIMDEAKVSANKSLAAIDWKALNENVSLSIDSALIIQSVNNALDNNKFTKLKFIKEGLSTANNELLKLQKGNLNVHFDQDNFNETIESAFAAIENIHFKVYRDSFAKQTITWNKVIQEQRKKGLKDKIKQAEALRKTAESKKRKSVTVLMNRPEIPVPPPALEDNEDDLVYYNNLPVEINYTEPAEVSLMTTPVYRTIINENKNTCQKTIRVIDECNGKSVHIIIEVRQ